MQKNIATNDDKINHTKIDLKNRHSKLNNEVKANMNTLEAKLINMKAELNYKHTAIDKQVNELNNKVNHLNIGNATAAVTSTLPAAPDQDLHNLEQKLTLSISTLEKDVKALLETDKQAAPGATSHKIALDITEKVNTLETVIKSLDNRVEMLETSDRDDVVIVDGIEPEQNKSLSHSVCNQLNKHMHLKLDPKEIIQCIFIGKIDDDENNIDMADPENDTSDREKVETQKRIRTIRVKMFDRRIKKLMLKRKGQLRKSKIYLKEHLTTRNNKIFYQARQARDYDICHHVWTDNERVWAIMNEGDKPIILDDLDSLKAL